jgi:hypothetical protein
VVFERRPDARYFLTMSSQEPGVRSESHDPYVVLNRLRTLLVTLEALERCDCCEQNNADDLVNKRALEKELQHQYQEINRLFTGINVFAEKVVASFDQHARLCKPCRERFQVAVTAAQAMQDEIYENPETPDTTWLVQSRCLDELFSANGPPPSGGQQAGEKNDALIPLSHGQ